MLRVNPIQTNFGAGELSPWLLGRTDLQQFQAGGEKIRNFLVRGEGGLQYRPGTAYTGAAATTANVGLLDFTYSNTESYCIEFSPSKIRFLQNGAFVTSAPDTPYQITTIYGTGTAIPYTSDHIPELHFTQSADVIYITHRLYPPATLSRYGATDWRYEVISFDFGPFQDQEPGEQDFSLNISNIVDRMTLKSSLTDDFLPATHPVNTFVEYAYSGEKFLSKIKANIDDETVTVEPLEDYCFSMAPEVYSPGIYTGWDGTNNVPTYSQSFTGTGVSVAFSNTGVVVREMVGGYLRFSDKAGNYYWMYVTGVGDIPQQVAYGVIAVGNILAVDIPGGIVTRSNRTVKTVLRSSASNFFDTTRDLGRKYRLVFNGAVLYATTRAAEGGEPANSGANMAVTLDRSPPLAIDGLGIVDKGTTNEWNRGAWFKDNYPRTVCFHEERLCFFGTDDEPQTGWMSKTADFYNFAPTDNQLRVLDSSAITFTIASNTVNQIVWATSHDGELVLGSYGGEHIVRPSSTGKPLTATNISVRLLSAYGSEPVQPVVIGKSIIYVQRGGQRIRQIVYTPQQSRVSQDLNLFAEHILRETESRVNRLTVCLLPNPYIIVTFSGNINYFAVLLFNEDLQQYAWSAGTMGGPAGATSLMSVAAVPESSNYHRLYFCVHRTISGSPAATIEHMTLKIDETSTVITTSNVFLDRHVTGTIATGNQIEITGLAGFNGQTVDVVLTDSDDTFVHFSAAVNGSGILTMPSDVLTYLGTGRLGMEYMVGYHYEGWFKAFPMEAPGMAGTGQGKPKRIHRISFRLAHTSGFAHGLDTADLYYETLTDPGTASFVVSARVSRDHLVTFPQGIDTRAQYHIKQTKPLPLALLAIMPEMAQNQ